MFFKRIESEGLAHYSYMVGDGGELAVIDPRRDVQVYLDVANQEEMRIVSIFETHRNEDCTVGSIELAEKTGADAYISAYEELGYVYGTEIHDGDRFALGGLTLKAVHTPGHTLGHMAYAVFEEGRDQAYLVFTGDCLFMGDLGRTDFYGEENLDKMTGLLYDSIVEKLYPLGEHVLIFPAHGAGSACGESMERRPYSTIGYERAFNPQLQVRSRQEFIDRFARMRIKPRYFEVMEVNNTQGAPFVHNPTSIPPLTLAEAHERDIQLYDIRSKEAFVAASVPGSLYVGRSGFSSYAGNLCSVTTPIAFISDNTDMDDLMAVYFMARRIGFEHVVGYVPSAIRQWTLSGREAQKIATITAEEYLAHRDDYRLLDVRKPEELSEDDPVSNRINLPAAELYKTYTQIPRDRELCILCASGERAVIAASFLKREGIEAPVIEGGIGALTSQLARAGN